MTVHHDREAFRGARAISSAFMAGLKPDPQMTVSEWANRRRKLPQETTKEHGRYKVARTPYIREVQDNLSASSPVVRTVLMKGAQLGGSETGLNFIGYIIDVAAGPVILVCPTVEMAERHSETRIKPMIRMSKRLKRLMGDPDARKPGNKILLKKFLGGVLVMTGANSGASLRSLPARYMIWEEPDAYPDDVDGEGSAVDIVAARGFTYGYRRKEFLNCTPKLASNSIIYAEFLAGDQRTYQMPCPNCGAHYAWDQTTFRWEGRDNTTAHMVCPHCEKPTHERAHKSGMMAAGVWVPKVTDPPRGMARSYYLPSFYSPIGMLSWFEIAKVAIAAETNFAKAKTYHNTYLGVPWTDAADTPDPAEILRVAEACPLRAREVPDWATTLFAGVDCGVDHIEIGVWAFGPRQRRHLVEQVRLSGSVHSPEQWARLTETLRRGYVHPLGAVLRISHVFIDRARFAEVDPWVRAQDPRFVSGIKGHKMDELIKPRVKPEIAYNGKPIPNSVALRYFLVNSSMLKQDLYGHINQPKTRRVADPQPIVTYHREITPERAAQLVGEEYVTKYNKNGRPTSNWVKRSQAQRVEALDTCNYARAAACWKGVDGWLDTDWRRERTAIEKAAQAMAVRIEGETKKRLAAGDGRPLRIVNLVEHVAFPVDAAAVEAEVEAAAAAVRVVEDTAPTTAAAPAFPSSWGGWAPREHTVPREAEDGVVGGGRTATVWMPEFGSIVD